jgi:hypothetical protein
VVLSWKRNSFLSLEKTGIAHSADVYRQRLEVELLQAAINLLPEEQNRIPDTEHSMSLQLVVRNLKNDEQIPWHTQAALIAKSALKAMHNKEVADVVRIAWIGGAPPAPFDPFKPTVRDSSGSSSEQAVTSFDLIVKDYVAMLMSGKRILELVSLANALSANPVSQDASSPLADEALNIVLGVAATVQKTACTTRQIQALRWLADQLAENEDQNENGTEPKKGDSTGVEALRVFLTDAWWQEQRESIWIYAADEGVAAPAMSHVTVVLNDPDSSQDDVAKAWGIVESKLNRWRSALRQGATEPLLDTMRAYCKRECLRLADGDLACSQIDSKTWLARAHWLRKQTDWLHMTCNTPAIEEMASLDRLLNDKEAESQLSTGLEMLREFVDNAASFSEGDQRQEQIASIHDAFHNCHGLDLHELHAGTVEQALARLSQNAITTEKQATLRMVLAFLSPQYKDRMDATHDDAKPWRSTQA